jgi:hypothetical protein
MRLFLAAALLVPSLATAQSGYVAAPSTRATTVVSLSLADAAAQRAAGKPATISIDYGQPHLRGRQLFQAEFVPMGSPWRLGANEATVLTTEVGLMLGSAMLAPGRYILFALPETSGWTLIVQKGPAGTEPVMAMQPDPAQEAARIPLRAATATESLESLSIALVPAAGTGGARGVLQINWEKVRLSADWMVH